MLEFLSPELLLILQRYEFSSKSQHCQGDDPILYSCCWYYKGTNFQANHNIEERILIIYMLLLILQRYEFSSKSQQNLCPTLHIICCCWYYKGTNFQANHNDIVVTSWITLVVTDTTKVRIFKQITTKPASNINGDTLLLILQRYEFSSKSQQFL